MTTTTTGRLNGVDLGRLNDTIVAIQGTPGLARFQFRARNQWIRGGLNRSTIQGFCGAGEEDQTRTAPFVLDNDEPDVLLGDDEAPNPVEYVLHALAGCLTSSLVYHAAARGIRIDRVESRLEGDLDLRGFLGLSPRVRNGYQAVRVAMRVEGNLTDAQRDELIELACSRSPVFDMLSNPVQVAVRAER